MADPLSIAASIAGVISLTDVVFIRTRKYLSSAKNADKEVKELSQEVLLLSGALHSLSKLAQALDAEGLKDQHIDNLRMHHIAACHATLDEVWKKLKKLEDNGAKRKLIWPFVSDRTKELLADVCRHRQHIDLALTADSLGTLLQVLSKTEEVQVNTEKMLEEAKKTREIMNRIEQNSGRKEIVNFFLPYNPQQNYEMSLSLRHPRTGLWLTRKPEFQTWLEHPDSALWLSGIPGAGKTVLAGTIIEEALRRSSEDIAIAFFFCDYKNAKTQTSVNVLSALASQLAIQKEEAYGYLERYYRELHPERALERRPGISDLQRILKDMVKSFDHVYLVVDGLDECGDSTDNVIDDILDVIECSDNISTALLSRDEYNIRDRLEDEFTGVEIAAHREDITEYVTSEIEKRISNKSLRIDDLSLKGEILERLIDGAKGMFRWVACQLDFLGDCLSDKECREALRQLPPGLNESYMRILQRVPTGKERTVQMILNFVAYADPKLDIPILREALSVPDKVGNDDALDPQSIIREGSITRLCRSLIRKSNDGCHYEFAHFSVKEFLEGEMMCMPEFEAFQVSESICHLFLAKQCLKYLLLRNFSSLPSGDPGFEEHLEMRIKQHPFYSYAAVCWPVFARSHWLDESLVKLAERLFQLKKTANFISWALELASFATFQYRCCEALHNMIDYLNDSKLSVLDLEDYVDYTLWLLPQLVDKNFTTLHMAAALSLPVICSILIEQGGNIDQRSGFGCPLQCAVQGLYLAGVHQDDPSSIISPYFKAEYWQERTHSSEFGRSNTIRLLLSSGATHISACSSPFAGHTLINVAMQLVIGMENIGVISILLEAGYEPEDDDLSEFADFRQSFLDIYGRGGNDHDDYGLKSLILCLSPMIDKSPAHFHLCQAAWSLAIEMGCEFAQDTSIIDTRISLSQDALAKTIFTAVQEANIERLSEALKDPRADLASLTGDGDNTIFGEWFRYLRSEPDGLNVLKILVSAGMEVNRPNKEGLLPIHEFAKLESDGPWANNDNRYEALRDIISDFIGKGTGCDAKSRANQNVFHLGLGSIRLIKAILAAETDENILTALRTRDENGHTPIALAVQDGQDEVALLLLERSNCDPEALKGPASVHALCVTGGTHRAFNVLLDAAVDLDLTGCIKTTLLHHVGPKTSKEFILQLVQMFPNGLSFRVDGKLPIDTYFESCINCASPAIDPDVLQLLAAPESEELDQREKKLVWENFTLSVQGARPLKETCERSHLNVIRDEIIAKMINSLVKLGFVQSYEAVTHISGALPLLKPLRDDLEDLWPVSSEAICGVLEQTVFWESLREFSLSMRLLKAAVKRCDVALVELLLKNGISVHQRIDEMSALEIACLIPATSPDAKQIFTILLEHADNSRLDEVNSYHGQGKGLIHYLAGPRKYWQLVELLDRAVDINIRGGTYIMTRTALIQHIFQGSPESAMLLLERGADPTAVDGCGIDAAMAAAFRGDMGFLLHLHAAEGQAWQLNWQRTCNSVLTGTKGVKLNISEMSALHLAAWSGHCDVLKFYIDKDLLTDLGAVSSEGLTSIHLAAFNGQVDAVKFLSSRGASLNLKSADGSLPLHLAVRNQHVEVVKFLVENGSAMDTDIRGLSPMEYAMRLQNQSIIDRLRTAKQYLDYQSKPGRRDKDIVYAYEQALKRGDVEGCELLRGQGCPVNIDLPGQEGRSALIMAIESSNKELIKWLLAHDAKANEQTRNADRTVLSPLQAMMMRPQLNDVLPLLLQKHQNEGGSAAAEKPSLICIASQHNNTQGLGLLLEHMETYEIEDLGAQATEHTNHSLPPVNQHRLNNATPLHWAAGSGNCEAIKTLLDHGADVNVFDDGGMTPLHLAIASERSNKSPGAKLLLRHGAALEHRDGSGSTAVMLASRRGNTELVRFLAESGADLRAVDFGSSSCLHLAVQNGHLELFVWLVSRGLRLHAKNSFGWSAVQYASFSQVFSSFLLNFNSAFDDICAMTYATPGPFMNSGPAWLKEHFNMYLRRLSLERLRALANLEPTDSWSPLCIMASIGQTSAVTNLLRLGADVDFEGSPSGSALVAACSSGRLESVKILVRHGAATSYHGKNGVRSAIDAARNHKAILVWLLVHRFTEQRKLSVPVEADSAAQCTQDVKSWSGIVKKELIITGIAERQVHESVSSYWFRLMAAKKDWRGKVVVQNKSAQTHRPSRLIPDESVRICPGDYGTPKERK